MVDVNTLSIYISIGIMLLGIFVFLASGFKSKYISASVVLGVGLRLSYVVYFEMQSLVPDVLIGLTLVFFVGGIVGTTISILLRKPITQSSGGAKHE